MPARAVSCLPHKKRKPLPREYSSVDRALALCCRPTPLRWLPIELHKSSLKLQHERQPNDVADVSFGSFAYLQHRTKICAQRDQMAPFFWA
jgi:hypothetical protein